MFGIIFSPDFPIAITILPQFGSSPAIAVLNKGELAIEKPIFFAIVVDLAPITFIVINFFAPSPSTTICLERFNANLCKAFSKSCSLGSKTLYIFEFFALPVAKIATISFVEVSPSTVIELNVVVATFLRIAFKNTEGIFASVNINDNIVAILGAIIPEPFAMPEILTNLLPILHSS